MFLPHEDALVLTLGVDNFDVRRVLIDPGSSVDLLQMSAYRQIGHSPSTLENLGRVLNGFNGVSIVFLGDFLLTRVSSIILNVRFSMVEDLSPYNSIMRRVLLHKMKTIMSTYHQMVSYLTEVGQVDLLSSQLVFRQCYQVTVEAGQIDPIRDELELSSAKD